MAAAETLPEALEAAYGKNPVLTAQRAAVRVADEGVPIARSAGMPTIEGTATYQENLLRGDPAPGGFFSNPKRQVVGGLSANVPLVDFGATGSGVKAARARVQSSRAGLEDTEAEVFTSVVAAYMDVLRDEAIVRLHTRNTKLMQYTLREVRDRRQAGVVGPTDVAQAEARVALAEAELETSRAQLVSSREQYIRHVGHAPGELASPPPLPQMPESAQAAVDLALEGNPRLDAAKAERAAAARDADAANAYRYPTLAAIGGINQYDYLGSLRAGTGPRNGDQGTTAFVGVQLKLPIFEGGRLSANLRQAQAKQVQLTEQATAVEREIVAQTRSSFATWKAAERVIVVSRRGVEANATAATGVTAETRVGLRPLIDQLNAEQERLNAQVTLVTAQRDAYVAGFALLAAMGKANARDLNFDGSVLYDPVAHYDKVEGRIFQFGREKLPEPEGSGTAQTPVQDALVSNEGIDPAPAQ